LTHGDHLRRYLPVLAAGAILAGCGPASKVQNDDATARKPELTITVASLNLTNLNKRIVRTDISRLWQQLRSEQVEVLAIQNLTRYPGVSTRIDPVTELARQADWRQAFGEMSEFSGRQVGNAILAVYPIRSNSVESYSGVRSAVNNGSLLAVVDGGVHDLLVVSAQLPGKASSGDQARCLSIIRNARGDVRMPMIVTGNLPATVDGFTTVEGGTSSSTRIVYDGLGLLLPTSASTVETSLGTMVIVRFAVFRQPV
jgi:endonuclease/exonuclease/phosphatase family metal-dependent hydrolase